MRYNIVHSPYTEKLNVRIHEDLLVYIKQLAEESGCSVPKLLSQMIEEECGRLPEKYSLNPFTDIFVLEHNPHESHASKQIKLFMKPEVLAQIHTAAEQTDTPERVIRLSLILDAMQRRNIRFF